MSNKNHIVEVANIQWHENGTPISEQFDDIYFSSDNGLEESRHIFIELNHLAERWQQLGHGKDSAKHALAKQETPHFVIAETGFGTGLNFLASWQLWLEEAPSNAILHYIAVEKHPLTKQDLRHSLSHWPELTTLATQLINAYPSLLPGMHVLHLQDNDTNQEPRVNLTLIFDDIKNALAAFTETSYPHYKPIASRLVDAWFLDGFAPSKNPQMWYSQLYEDMARLSKQGSSFATFTSAGQVRRGLEQAGFKVQKNPGYGKKRESCSGAFEAISEATLAKRMVDDKTINHSSKFGPLWYIQTDNSNAIDSRHAVIIGGGIAGCSTAYSLAKRGWQITLIERQAQLASEGSGNPAGIIYSKLATTLKTPQNRFALSSFLYAQRMYRDLFDHGLMKAGQDGNLCGVLQLAYNQKEQSLRQRLREFYGEHEAFLSFIAAADASELSGINIGVPATYFPQAGWISLKDLCLSYCSMPGIKVIVEQEVDHLTYIDNQWQLNNKAGELLATAPVVVIANATDALHLSPTEDLSIKKIRGQVSIVAASHESQKLQCVICHDGYVIPTGPDNNHCLGATYTRHDKDDSVKLVDHRINWQKLQDNIPSLANALQTGQAPNQDPEFNGKAAFRCVSPDYLPLVGPVPKRADFLCDYGFVRKNARAHIPIKGSYFPGLYANIGHGSRGLASTPICAQLLASQICNEIRPMEQDLVKALNPARFIIRDLERNKI